MSSVCCPDCRLRFSPAVAGYLAACPQCGEPPQPMAGLEGVVGFRLFTPEDVPPALPEALEVSMPIPDLNGRQS
jgi:hypothetical protein